MAQGRNEFFYPSDEVRLEIPALQKPTLAELNQYLVPFETDYCRRWVESIEWDNSPTGQITFKLATMLIQDDSAKASLDYGRALSIRTDMLGFQHAKWIVENQPSFSTTTNLIVFLGIIVSNGRAPYYFFLQRDNNYAPWRMRCHWFNGFGPSERLAISAA